MIKVKKLTDRAKLPHREHFYDAGADLFVPLDAEDVLLMPGEFKTIGTGISISIQPGQVGLIHPRSGLASMYGVTVLNAPGTIDAGYEGEIKVILHNVSDYQFMVQPGMKIAQLVIQQVLNPFFVEGDPDNDVVKMTRGEKGFGSSGLR